MPNYVSNTLSSEDALLIDDVLDLMGEREEGELVLDFQKIIPIPTTVPIKDRSMWMISNWGTNRTRATDVQRYGADLNFETAWTPVIPIVQEISRLYNDGPVWEYTYDDGESVERITLKDGEIISREDLVGVYLTESDLSNMAYFGIGIEEIRERVENVNFNRDIDELDEGGLWDFANDYIIQLEGMSSNNENFYYFVSTLYNKLWERAENELVVFKVRTLKDLENIPSEELEELSDKELEKLSEIGDKE